MRRTGHHDDGIASDDFLLQAGACQPRTPRVSTTMVYSASLATITFVSRWTTTAASVIGIAFIRLCSDTPISLLHYYMILFASYRLRFCMLSSHSFLDIADACAFFAKSSFLS